MSISHGQRKLLGAKLLAIELDEMGPQMDLQLGRFQETSEEKMSFALKKPKETVVFYFSSIWISDS